MRTRMPIVRPVSRAVASDPRSGSESGVALVLTLIFSILLYVLVAELVVSGRMVRATGENDALLARMRTQMAYELDETTDQLLEDLAGAAAAAEGGGAGGAGLGGAMAGAAPGGQPAEAGGEEEGADPAASCDSSRDTWFHPIGKPDNDLTTYVWVEDENRKFNILALWSPDEKFAEFSRDRLVRLIDTLREDSDFDVSTSDAERIVQELKDWVARPDTDAIPRPELKSDDPKRREITIPMHLDELLMLPSVTEDLFYDKVLDGIVYLGLESTLTIWTSLIADPGDPEKVARQKAEAAANGEKAAAGTPGGASGAPGEAGGAAPGATPGGQSGSQPGGTPAPPPQPLGEGIRININTASRPVLRALFPSDKIPDRVIDAILKWRNEEDPKELEKEGKETPKTDLSDFGDMRLGADKKLKFFATTADLEQIEEFKSLPDPQIKADFQKAITTKSDVFSIHLATLYKRSEQNRVYLLRRARSIVQRVDDGADGLIRKLVPWEERTGLRLQPIDLQDASIDLSVIYSNMDQFAQEDRAWNPFLIDFFLPKQKREEFYQPK